MGYSSSYLPSQATCTYRMPVDISTICTVTTHTRRNTLNTRHVIKTTYDNEF